MHDGVMPPASDQIIITANPNVSPNPSPAFIVEGSDLFVGTDGAAGPWSAGLCHGGAPAALILRVAEAVPTLTTMEVARLSLELFRPVPTARLLTRTDIIREGKKLQLVMVHLESEGVEVARGTVLKLRTEPQDIPIDVFASGSGIPSPEILPLDHPRFTGGFARQFELRVAKGAFRQPGPATLWFRLKGALFSDGVTTPVQVAAAVADFSNGASTPLSFREWTFLNADLSINFFRAPQGEWIAIEAETWVGPDGRALARSKLADRQGWFGQATQSLLLQRR
jgi:Thioesterase-like superfamily